MPALLPVRHPDLPGLVGTDHPGGRRCLALAGSDGRGASADDLVQETLRRALESLDSFRGESSLATWLHRILHNASVDRARRNSEDPSDDVAALVEEQWRDGAYTVDAALVASRAQAADELRDGLLRLPCIYRSAVVLHDMEGLTMVEIARIQALSLPAAKQRLRRGRMMLVSALARGAERRAAGRGVPLLCWDARSMVSDYLDDELASSDRQLLESHLAECPTCPPLYAGLVEARAALGHLRDDDSVVPEHMARRLGGLSPDGEPR